MSRYWRRLVAYHRSYLVLYGLVGATIYLFYVQQWPTPLSLILSPLGLEAWSAGLTRASVRLLMGDWSGAWAYNPLIFLVIFLGLIQVFVAPVFVALDGE